MDRDITPGVYRHFKGGIYQVMEVATHSETEESLVVYKNASERFFVRPLDMFLECVDHEGAIVPRFEKLPD